MKLNFYEKIESNTNGLITLDYESFIITFITTTEGNMIISLANDDIAKNNDEEFFNIFIKNFEMPWGRQKIKLSTLIQENEKSFIWNCIYFLNILNFRYKYNCL